MTWERRTDFFCPCWYADKTPVWHHELPWQVVEEKCHFALKISQWWAISKKAQGLHIRNCSCRAFLIVGRYGSSQLRVSLRNCRPFISFAIEDEYNQMCYVNVPLKKSMKENVFRAILFFRTCKHAMYVSELPANTSSGWRTWLLTKCLCQAMLALFFLRISIPVMGSGRENVSKLPEGSVTFLLSPREIKV